MSDIYLTSDRKKFKYDGGVRVGPFGNPVKKIFVPVQELSLSGITLAAHGVTGKFQYVTVAPLSNGDAVEFPWVLPMDVDRKNRIYVSAVLIASAALTSNATLTFKYDKLKIGTDAAAAAATNLDQAISGLVASDVPVDIPFSTDWGWINPDSSAFDLLHLRLEATTIDDLNDADKLRLLGIGIAYVNVDNVR